jgi:hypothetical protein
MRLSVACGFLFSLAVASPGARGDDGSRDVDFNRDIRPILSETCYQCHGPDKKARKAELRLDTKEGLFKSLKEGTVVVPRKPEESELYLRITSDDDNERMPPPKALHAITKGQVALIKRWIEQGAVWQGHWAYQKPTRPAVPAVKEAPFIKNDIDRFIQEKLDERGLKPSPEADRITLIRRLSFDLTGLPPTPAAVDAFVADESADAYEKLVDRLLAAPQFGERMAVFWLDLVRYADSAGYHSDNPRDVWLYRDYVIKAFNENKPFDRFTIEQLAGDLLPNPTNDQRIASGYNRLLQTTEEGGGQAKEYLAKYAADRVRNIGSVWLASTLGCTECHDHKYDPFLTREFYSFEAFFADLKETPIGRQEQVKIPNPTQAARLAELDGQMAVHRKVLDTTTPALAAAQADWEKTHRTHKVDWAVLSPSEAKSQNGATLKVLDDGAVLVSGAAPETDVYTITLKSDRAGISGLRLEALPDPTLPSGGPGRASNGNFVLNELAVTVNDKANVWSSVTATHAQANYPAAAATDGNPTTGWAILPQAGKPNELVLESLADVGEKGTTTLVVSLRFLYGGQHALGKFRFSATTAPRPIRAQGVDGIPKDVHDALAIEPARRTDGQKQAVAAYYRTIAPALAPARGAVAEIQRQKDQLQNEIPATLISQAMPPRTIRVLPRGNWLDDSGPIVDPAVPATLGVVPVKDRRATRLDLANWLVSRDNPLVARVFVNRLWKLAFGQGIVTSLEDFGSQGAWPIHPHLLDWMAVEFIDGGWNVKETIKRMVMSGTYRQSSVAGESLRQRDPANLWLARQGRFRLDAETIRDNALAIGGILSEQVGGPSVKPYQPAGYWAHMNFPKREYVSDHGVSAHRRGLYTWWQRTFLHPSLLAFDAPTREECTVARPRSNTPLQALVLLNDPNYVESARAFAERIIREGGSDVDGRVNHAFRLALSRKARAAELKLITDLYRKQLSEFRADPASANESLSVGERPVPKDIDTAELAAWTSVARVILNLYETITRS